MAVAYANHTEIIDTDANNSVTVTPPASLAAGETWLALAYYDAPGLTLSGPASPWVQIGSQFGNTSDPAPLCGAWYKVAVGSDADGTITCSAGSDFDAVVYSVRITGAHASAPLDATGTPNSPTGFGTTVDAPDITIAENGSLAILMGALQGNEATFTKPATATMPDSRVGAGLYPVCGFAYESVNAGPYAPSTWGFGSSNGRAAQTFSLKPAAAGGRTTKNTRSNPLGSYIGIELGMPF